MDLLQTILTTATSKEKLIKFSLFELNKHGNYSFWHSN